MVRTSHQARETLLSQSQSSWRLLALLGASRSDALPSEMKGVHPEEKSSETGSEAPCVMPRGVQQKRSQNALGREPRVAKLRAVACSKPRCSLVTRIEEAEPLQVRRRQQTPTKWLDREWLVSSSGVAGTARSKRKALNVRDLDRRGLQPQPSAQGRKPRRTGRREVGGARSTVEDGESRWREGASLGNATSAGKEGRLWRH